MRIEVRMTKGAAAAALLLALSVCAGCSEDGPEGVRGEDTLRPPDATGEPDLVGASDAPSADDAAWADIPPVSVGSWDLYGEVRIDEDVAGAGASQGTLYVALLERCGAWSSPQQLIVMPGVDLAQGPETYFFEVEPGEWFLSAFLDRDPAGAGGRGTRPSSGDLALRNDEDGTSCLRYRLGGGRGTIEQALVLDGLVP